jgi:hypothetical protein
MGAWSANCTLRPGAGGSSAVPPPELGLGRLVWQAGMEAPPESPNPLSLPSRTVQGPAMLCPRALQQASPAWVGEMLGLGLEGVFVPRALQHCFLHPRCHFLTTTALLTIGSWCAFKASALASTRTQTPAILTCAGVRRSETALTRPCVRTRAIPDANRGGVERALPVPTVARGLGLGSGLDRASSPPVKCGVGASLLTFLG